MRKIWTVAPESLFPDQPEYKSSQTLESLTCPVCKKVLQRPVEVECGKAICASCLCTCIERELSCPCCHTTDFTEAHIRKPNTVVVDLLKNLLVICKQGCRKIVRANAYTKHLQSKCLSHYERMVDSPSRVTIGEVLSKSTADPVTPSEKKVAENLIRRLMAENKSEPVIHVPTRGQVPIVLNLIKPYLFHNCSPFHSFK